MSDRIYCNECERWIGGGVGHDTDEHEETVTLDELTEELAEITGATVEEIEGGAEELTIEEPQETVLRQAQKYTQLVEELEELIDEWEVLSDTGDFGKPTIREEAKSVVWKNCKREMKGVLDKVEDAW